MNKTFKIIKSESLFGFFISGNNLTARELYFLRSLAYNFNFSILKLSKSLGLHFFNVKQSGIYFYTNHLDFLKYFNIFVFFSKTKFKLHLLFFKVLYNSISINFFFTYISFFKKLLSLTNNNFIKKVNSDFLYKFNILKFYIFKFNLYNIFSLFYLFKIKLLLNLFYVNN